MRLFSALPLLAAVWVQAAPFEERWKHAPSKTWEKPTPSYPPVHSSIPSYPGKGHGHEWKEDKRDAEPHHPKKPIPSYPPKHSGIPWKPSKGKHHYGKEDKRDIEVEIKGHKPIPSYPPKHSAIPHKPGHGKGKGKVWKGKEHEKKPEEWWEQHEWS